MTERALADDMKHEADLLRRRFVHHTRPRGPLALDQAHDLCKRMDGADGELGDGK